MQGVPDVSIVVPVYNSPDIVALLDRIDAAFRGRAERYEVILVDDGSPDPRLWPRIEQLARDRNHVRVVQLSRNFGQQAATLCGLQEARGSYVVTMDDDLQHDPADIPLLLAHADRDIVIGQLVAKQHHLARRAVSRVKNVFDRLVIGTPKGLQLSSFRLLSRTVVDGVLAMRTARPFLPALMFHVSKDAAGVLVTHSRRASGRSGYTVSRLLGVFSNLVISNSSILLRAGAYAGFTLAFLSFVLAGVVIYRKLAHGVAVQGWTSLFAAILLIGGLLLIGLGIIGEYLIRIIESGEAKPPYIVRRRRG
ncbi:MAG TPA: glycosyltransferase family 2 protein [Thermoanaerobaculia bacterium]|nr:glycosyltransferase family 2 protein [Thermoanaerobaculia bacterium]